MLITLLNLNHLGCNLPCQVSALGWIFCFAFFFFSHQPKKGSAVSEKMARENTGACSIKKNLATFSCKGLESSCFRERTGNLQVVENLVKSDRATLLRKPFSYPSNTSYMSVTHLSWAHFSVSPFWPWQDSLGPSEPSCTQMEWQRIWFSFSPTLLPAIILPFPKADIIALIQHPSLSVPHAASFSPNKECKARYSVKIQSFLIKPMW